MEEKNTSSAELVDAGVTSLTSDKLIERLRRALSRDGDFPASAKVVSELRMLTNDPNTTANQITEVILKEPSLGTRVLSLVNSSFYRRAKPIMTVSQAVIQIGMKPLADLCAGLVLLQKFVPAARRDSAFANCLRKLVITSLLSSSVGSTLSAASSNGKTSEAGYLAGSLAEMGTLLLAYYFPKIYEAAVKRAESKKQDIGKSIQEITGLSPLRLSIEVVTALDLPPFYKEVLMSVEKPEASKSGPNAFAGGMMPSDRSEISRVAKGVYAAQTISEIVASGKGKQEIDRVLTKVSTTIQIDEDALGEVIGTLSDTFQKHCDSIELNLPSIPEYVPTKSADKKAPGTAEEKPTKDPFAQFIEEIRAAVENSEPTASIITSVMETMAWSLKFDRVLLLLLNPNKSALMGRMFLGQGGIDPKQINRRIGAEADIQAPDARALRDSRPIFFGNPVLENGWPLAVVPIGFGTRAVGVIYADRINKSKEQLSSKEQAAITMLAELLNRSMVVNA